MHTTSSGSQGGWWLLSGAITLWLLWATLRPDGHISSHDVNLIPLAEHSRALTCLLEPACPARRRAGWFLLIDVVGNIAVFVPLGVGLAGALYCANPWLTLARVIGLGFSLSLAIELLQLTLPSRSTDVDDLLFNTVGTAVGALLFLMPRLLNKSRLT